MTESYNIGIDVQGGDNAPECNLNGVLKFIKGQSDLLNSVSLFLFGEGTSISQFLGEDVCSKPYINIVDCSERIGFNDHPVKAFLQKTESGITKGFHYLKTGKIDAFASAGNTGAMMVGATQAIGLVEGISRPVITSILPRESGNDGIILDVGINADCKPEHLHQFALLGNKLMKSVYNLVRPAVGLLNIGEEQDKGNQLTKETHKLLSSDTSLNFIGNIEGRELFNSKAHIIVCDGFTGNIILKTAEGLGQAFLDKGIKDDYLINFDYTKHGGTPLLGLKKPVIIAHGISKKETVENMVKLAIDVVNSNLFEKIEVTL